MTSQEKTTQLRVGIFLAIGLGAVAAMVVYFGRFGDAVKKYYPIRVEYPNASGIYRGASVLLAGAKIGAVENSPVILPEMDGVSVDLRIYEEVKIPGKAEFTIGSSGLLGDRFIQIVLGKGAKDSPPIKPGDVIKGKGEAGIGDITEKAGEVMVEVKEALGGIKETVSNINVLALKLNSEVLKNSTVADFNTTVSNLKATSQAFAEASKRIDGLVNKAETTITTGQGTMQSAKEAADEFKKAMIEVNALVRQARQGRGMLGALLADKEMADNLRTLVENLRKRGILWYKDSAPESR